MKNNTEKTIQEQSFAHLLIKQAQQNPDKEAFLFVDESHQESLTFSHLQNKVVELAAHLTSHVQKNDRILILIPPSLDFIKTLFTCFYVGATAVPFYIPINGNIETYLDFLEKIVADADIQVVLTTNSLKSAIHQQKFAQKLYCIDINAIKGNPHYIKTSTCWDDLALLLYTSGSTGDPKGVMLTHGNLLHNMFRFQQHSQLNEDEVILTWLPNSPVAGLYTRLLGIILGAKTIIFPTHLFLQKPLLWLEYISKYKVTFSAAPNFAYDLCSQIVQENTHLQHMDLSSWKMAISGGEIIRIDTLKKFIQTFAKYGFSINSFFPYYGSTEGLCITLPKPQQHLKIQSIDRDELLTQKVKYVTQDDENRLVFVSNGSCFSDTTIQIVHPNTHQICGEHEVGEVWIHSASNTKGYWQKEEYSEEICEAYLENQGPFYRTGDLGFIKDNELYITGRLKELIILNGKNYYPEDIERTALANVRDEIISAAAFSVDIANKESLVIVLGYQQNVPAKKWQQILDRLQSIYSQKHSVRVHGFIIVPDQDIPRASTRKIKRSVCRSYYLSGKFTLWGQDAFCANNFNGLISLSQLKSLPKQKQQTELLNNIAEYLSHVLTTNLSEDAWQKPLHSLGIDSIAMVKILTQLNKHFQINLPNSIFFNETSIYRLSLLITDGLESKNSMQFSQKIDFADEINTVNDMCQNLAMPRAENTNNIFITGGTGFLGSYLIYDLLTRSNFDKIYYLVRSKNKTEARERIQEILRKSVGWHESFSSRLIPIIGSADQELFGLSSENFTTLAQSIDVILHNAANVNFVAPYDYLKPVNTKSCLEVLRLATTHKLKPIHFVSTLAVFNSPERAQYEKISEDIFLQDVDKLYSGYAQSKWVAERIFQEAKTLSVPISIYRPGLITGDSKTGYCNVDDFLCRFIKGCIQNKKFPEMDIEIDMSPVDYVSKTIISLLSKENEIYHLANPNPILLKNYVKWLKKYGFDLDIIDFEQWLLSLNNESMENNELFPVLPFITEKHPKNNKTFFHFFSERKLNYDCSNVTELMGIKACPSIDHHLLELYMRYFLEIGYLSQSF